MENKLILSKEFLSDNNGYVLWLDHIKQLYRSSQIKASLKVNKELLGFYWQLGKEMTERKIEEVWGSGVVERLSMDLKNAFPMSKGFSTTPLPHTSSIFLSVISLPSCQ